MAIVSTFASMTPVKICTTSSSNTSLDSTGEDAPKNAPQHAACPPTTTTSVEDTVREPETISRSQKVFTKLVTDIEKAPSVKPTMPTEMTTPVTTPADTVVSDPFSPASNASTSASSATATPVKPLKSILKNGPKSFEATVETDNEDEGDELSDSDESSDEDESENEDDEDDEVDDEDESEEDDEDDGFESDYEDSDDSDEDDNEGELSHFVSRCVWKWLTAGLI